MSFADLAYRSYYEPAQLPPGMPATLEATARFTSQAMIHWANATHACTCEVDVETGHVTLTRYIVSEDVGAMINPNVVEGQIAGGTVQGHRRRAAGEPRLRRRRKPAVVNVCRLPAANGHRSPADRIRPHRDPGTGGRRLQGRWRGRCHRLDTRGDQRDQRRVGAAGCDPDPVAGFARGDRRVTGTGAEVRTETWN